jgi:sugar phosphate isomerase/epimerase
LKLGVLLSGRRPADIAERLVQCRDAGFSLCQLNLLQSGISRADMVQIADAMFEQGIRPLAVGCYVNPMRPSDAGFSGACRDDLETILSGIDILGARRVVLWSGSFGERIFDHHEKNHSPDALEILKAFVTDVVRTTKARNYQLVLEPWHAHVLDTEERVASFHASLDPYVQPRVRYVLDAVAMMTPERYLERNIEMTKVCTKVGPLSGMVHLRDLVMPPDGDASIAAPGEGRLDFPGYLQWIEATCPQDAGAIVRNIGPAQFAAVRDYLLRTSQQWELA